MNQNNNLNLVFNFTYNDNILESIFLKYLPYHKFYILYSKEFKLKFEKEETIIQFLISRTSIYFYKFVSIHLEVDNHTFWARKINLFRNLMHFDNTMINTLQVFKNIKIQKNNNKIKNYLNVNFTNFLNHKTNILIYKNYTNSIFIKIQSEQYSFPIIMINEQFLKSIINYFIYENDNIEIYLNNNKIINLMYKEKKQFQISHKYIDYIINVFNTSKDNFEHLHSNYINDCAKIIQKQLVESMYNNKYKLCRKICYNTYFNELNLN
jgi:hypothetical protein